MPQTSQDPDAGSDDDGGEQTQDDELGPKKGCCVSAAEMMAVRDLNKKPPWKQGNQYRTVCPECNATQFASKEYWKHSTVQFVIPRGEAEPVILYTCPYDDCDGDLEGEMDECPECEREIEWED